MLRLYDTRTRQVEPVEPERRGSLRLYSCGPAVYRPAHAGDLRACLLADLIRRTVERSGRTVTSCQGITDVRLLAGDGETDPAEGGEGGETGAEGAAGPDLARHYEEAFRADCAALNIRPAEFTLRVSESIGLIIELIGPLLADGHAYQVPSGSVYFAAEPGQRSPADWALWHAAPAGAGQAWPAPWGSGLPSRPTACAAMSLRCLGEFVDVHTGGLGPRSPHDEHVRALSAAVTGHEVVQHWVHGEALLFGGRRMAQAAGNVLRPGDAEARGLDPLALRLAFLEHRYRQQMNLSWETLAAADGGVRRWRDRVAEWANSPSRPMCAQYVSEFTAALDDDLDSPAALRVLRGLDQDGEIPPGSKFETFVYLDQVLGLDLARDIGKAPAPRLRPPGAD